MCGSAIKFFDSELAYFMDNLGTRPSDWGELQSDSLPGEGPSGRRGWLSHRPFAGQPRRRTGHCGAFNHQFVGVHCRR